MSRDKFEAHCVEQLIVARAAAQARGEKLQDDVGETSVESLCWKDANGDYGVRQLNAAWLGYQWAIADMQAEQPQHEPRKKVFNGDGSVACEWS